MIIVKELFKQFNDNMVLRGIDEAHRAGRESRDRRTLRQRKIYILRCLNMLEIPTSGEMVRGKL